jgi:hypothetical protein
MLEDIFWEFFLWTIIQIEILEHGSEASKLYGDDPGDPGSIQVGLAVIPG